ncbi:MAG: hypothetical protein QOJ11_2604 [Frankiales bacterium]|nr:hypothetical protein [Frankiales bacterium]
MQTRSFVGGVAGALLLSGCAQGTRVTRVQVAGPSGFPSAAAAHPLVDAVHFRDGISFDVPAASASPAVSAEVAYRSCATDGACDPGKAPDIGIASVTIPDVEDAAGTKIIGRLAYVLTWSGVPCVGAGPAAADTPTACTMYQLVDAGTGKTLYSMDHN